MCSSLNGETQAAQFQQGGKEIHRGGGDLAALLSLFALPLSILFT